MADAYALFAPLGIALHGFACLLHGDCAGRPAAAPLGVTLPGLTLPRYPSDLYEAVLTLSLFGALLLLSARRARGGVLVGVFLVGYPLVRSLVDLTRLASSTSLWGDVAPALVLVAVGVGFLARIAGRNAAVEPST
jgi:prolipoprotein diacylglyceryltransferase